MQVLSYATVSNRQCCQTARQSVRVDALVQYCKSDFTELPVASLEAQVTCRTCKLWQCGSSTGGGSAQVNTQQEHDNSRGVEAQPDSLNPCAT